jgi:galactoside O-acetyltransferase
MAVLNRTVVENMGFASVGRNVMISERASFFRCANITIGDNVRIDDFCVISAGVGGVSIGRNVHIAVHSVLIGAGRIVLSDFSMLSSRVSIYSSSDDYSGAAMTNPTVPERYRNVQHADVHLGRHVAVGSGSVILPGVRLEDGVAVGALSLVKQSCAAFGIYAGNPAQRVRERKRDLLELERRLVDEQASPGTP